MEPGLSSSAEFSINAVFQQIAGLAFFLMVFLVIVAGVRNWSKIESFQMNAIDYFVPLLRIFRWWTSSICRLSIVIMISVCILGVGYGLRGFQ